MILGFTVLLANFAEAIAEGRGKAQADALRAANRPRGTLHHLYSGHGLSVYLLHLLRQAGRDRKQMGIRDRRFVIE